MAYEMWMPSPDAAGYEISNLGSVRNGATGRKLATFPNRQGYQKLSLSVNGKQRNFTVHRLVCAAFHGPSPFGMEVDHINAIVTDNRASNLRWVTPSQNKSTRRFASGSNHGRSKLTEDIVKQIREIAPTMTRRKAAEVFGVDNSTICDIVNHKIWRHV